MSPEQVLRESLRAWNAGDRDGHRDCYAEDAVLRELPTGREVHGAEAIADLHFAWREAFPTMRGEVENLIVAGDQVVLETTWRGTHDGTLSAPGAPAVPPSANPVAVPACMVLRFRDGRIAEQRHYFDMATLMAQVGARPGDQ